MNYKEMVEIAKTNVCAECGAGLIIRRNLDTLEHEVVCGQDHSHKGFQRQFSLTELYKSGKPLPPEIERGMEKKFKPAEFQTSCGNKLMPRIRELREDLQTGEMLDEAKITSLINYAYEYGLDPFLGHVCLMYGEPYPTIDGLFYNAEQTKVKWTIQSHPMSSMERALYQVPEDAYAWICFVTREDSSTTFLGQGIVTAEEVTGESKKRPGQLAHPVAALHPTLMAQKRAEWQALRRAFPLKQRSKG